MPVYNGEAFVREAVRSILSQTFTDFELLAIDDGSADASAATLESFADPRIRLVRNEANLGLIATLNRGIELAQGDYVLRMDCDDLSLPKRLQRQVEFMDAHPEVGVCGVWYLEFGDRVRRTTRCARDHDSIRCGTLFNPVVGHPTVILRRELLLKHGLRYDAEFLHAEDYRLWAEALRYCRFANIPEVLLHYRLHSGQVTSVHAQQQMESAGRVRRALLQELGLEPTPDEFEVHQMLSALTRPVDFPVQHLPPTEQLGRIDAWLCKLKRANDVSAVYPEPQFSRMLVERWVGVCVVNFLAKGIFSPKLFTVPELFCLTGPAWRYTFAFISSRIRAALRDS